MANTKDIEVDETALALAATPYEASKALQEVGLEDAFKELTSRQQMVYRFRMRKIPQTTIATMLNISQPTVARELAAIRAHFKETGSEVDQEVTIGESVCLFDEIATKAWEVYTNSESPGDQLKALGTIMAAKEKQLKLLMDVGRLEKAGTKSTIEHTVSPLVQEWSDVQKKLAAGSIVEATFTVQEEPLPPDELETEDFLDDED